VKIVSVNVVPVWLMGGEWAILVLL